MGLNTVSRVAVPVGRPERAGHRRQLGLTLIELLVSIAILATIGGSIAGAFAIGLKILSPGNAAARLTGSHDLLAFEQQIGADVARADCFVAPGQTSIPSGGCGASVQKSPSTCGTGYVLCMAYALPGSTTCHTIVYSQLATDKSLSRRDNVTGVTERFTTGGLMVTASWTPFATTNNGYNWTKQVVVAVTQQGTPGAPTSHPSAATYRLVPLVADPNSPVSGGTSPC